MPDPMSPPATLADRLRAGQLSWCLRCTLVTGPQLAPLAAAAGFEAFYLDLEHSTISAQDVARTCAAAAGLPTTGLVRVPEGATALIGPLLDDGAQGVIAPHVETAEQARAVVAACRYPPAGDRSVTGLMPQTGFRATPLAEVAQLLNPRVSVVVMVESARGLESVADIAAVEGVDLVLVGTSDLSMQLGVPGQHGHPRIRAAYRRVAEATHGRCAFGVAGIGDPELIAEYVGLGARFVSAGRDVDLLLGGARRRLADLGGIGGRA